MKIPANTRPFSVSRSWFAAAGLLASLSLAPAYGANIDLGTSGDWSVPGNWVGGVLPSDLDTAVIKNDLTATIGSYTVTVNGATVGTTSNNSTVGTLNVNTGGALVTVGSHLTVGNRGIGTVNVNGGTINAGGASVNKDIWLGQNSNSSDSGSGTLNLYSGTVTTRTLMLGRSNGNYYYSEGFLNIYDGSLTASVLSVGLTTNYSVATYGEILISGALATVTVNGDIVLDNSKITYALADEGVTKITATGNVTLAGELALEVLSGVGVLPSSIILLETDTSQTITGTFDGYTSGETYTWGSITGTYVIDDVLKQVRIDNISIPEPASTALMVGGLAALLVFLQRRRRR
ncbi:PEP-CTERM sorting domain-containing protein [Ruficoccus amylovorans]|uniref:PEP-CTERM sorting domain-containing protein n=1 Tax=Ruficoccus amylovorans TaxID=1804625 RepID=A0A842HFK7_9BACT|nr:PEP-CTERM sorting domain-containing protein [Ruficoccus amylovorans]MBC2594357.1 PEP-CTERM sorting domain-containing protein [Ruficoccus amylovorans]